MTKTIAAAAGCTILAIADFETLVVTFSVAAAWLAVYMPRDVIDLIKQRRNES